MTDQPHRVDFHRPPNRPVEGCTINVTPAAAEPDPAAIAVVMAELGPGHPHSAENYLLARRIVAALAAARSSPEAPPANCPDCEWNRERGPYTMCAQHEIEGAVSPEGPAPAGPQVFNCDQSPHPPVVPCLRCEPVGGAS